MGRHERDKISNAAYPALSDQRNNHPDSPLGHMAGLQVYLQSPFQAGITMGQDAFAQYPERVPLNRSMAS